MTNTKQTLIADRYSNALIDIAKEGKLTYEKIDKDLKLIQSTLVQSKDLKEFLNNPVISVEDKKEVVTKIFKAELDVLILNFLKLLIDKNRFEVFDSVLNSFLESMDNINNISRVKVTSAVDMNEYSKKKLIEKLESKLNKKVILDLEINQDIIAGLVIRIGDNVIDTSLKNKLEDLSKNITK